MEKVREYWEALKEKFMGLIDVLNPANWFKDMDFNIKKYLPT